MHHVYYGSLVKKIVDAFCYLIEKKGTFQIIIIIEWIWEILPKNCEKGNWSKLEMSQKEKRKRKNTWVQKVLHI